MHLYLYTYDFYSETCPAAAPARQDTYISEQQVYTQKVLPQLLEFGFLWSILHSVNAPNRFEPQESGQCSISLHSVGCESTRRVSEGIKTQGEMSFYFYVRHTHAKRPKERGTI